MKIISLNMWGGRRFDALMDFFKREKQTTDIFCLQETIFGGPDEFIGPYKIRGDLFGTISKELSEHQPLHQDQIFENYTFLAGLTDKGMSFGLSMFISKKYTILESGAMNLYEGDPFVQSTAGMGTGVFLWARIEDAAGVRRLIGTVHGLFLDMRVPSPSKRDTPERLFQSRRLVDFFASQTDPGLIIGDFNLRPTTESVAILSGAMRNLVAEYGITNTRNHEYVDMEKYEDYIADYAFVSPEIKVSDFKVLPDVVSDHAPLMLECE
jgi:hypothetical protein